MDWEFGGTQQTNKQVRPHIEQAIEEDYLRWKMRTMDETSF